MSLVLDSEPGDYQLQAGALSAYLNGEKFGSGRGIELWSHPDGIGLGAVNGTTRFHDGVGRRSGHYSLDGALADFQLYNRALSAEEVALPASQDSPPPQLDVSIQLANDTSATGTPNNDGLTRIPDVSGQVETNLTNFSLLATFAGQGTATDITAFVDADGVFSLTTSELETILGTSLVDGSYSLTVQALDNQGNELSVQSLSFTLDQTAPLLTLDSPAVNVLQSPDGRLIGALTDTSDIAIATCQIDGGTPEAIALSDDGTFDPPLSISEGRHELQINVTDLTGNQTTQVTTFLATDTEVLLQLTEDTSATGVSNDDGITQNPGITGQLTTGLAGVQVFIAFAGQNTTTDITQFVDGSGAFSLTQQQLADILGVDLTDSTYSLTVQAFDSQGTELDTQSLSFTLDQTAPLLTLDSPAVDVLQSPDGRLIGALTNTSEIAIATYQIDGGNSEAITFNDDGSFDVPLLVSEGQHELQINVVDIAGNQTTQTIDFLATNTEISLQLTNDTAATGVLNDNGITQIPDVTGQLITASAGVQVFAIFAGQGAETEITQFIGGDGTFNLSQLDLENIFGSSLIDGDYSLTLRVVNAESTELTTQSLTFTLDQTAPVLQLDSPIVEGIHSPEGRLVGSLADDTDIVIATYQLDGAAPETILVDADGRFNLPLSVTEGLHQLQVSVTDQAGNQTTQTLDFSAAADTGFTQPNGSQGWYGTTATSVVLGEENSLVSEAYLPVALGQAEGSRTLSFDVESIFDRSSDGALGDRLLVYLVDDANPDQTLLDMGVARTPLFILGETGAEFQPGLVRYNGITVEIDTTSISDAIAGRLVFQLLNFDGDTGSVIRVDGLENTVDPEGQVSPVFPMNRNVVQAGQAIALDDLNSSEDLKAIFKQVRFDAETGTYRADLQITNTGTENLSRRTAVRFGNLPNGIEIQGISGVDAEGNPYINLQDAISSGGLRPGATSGVIEIVVENPNFLSLDWQIDILSAGVNQAPIFEAIAPITVTPGTPFKLPLLATDADGDNVTYSINPQGDLPSLLLRGDGTLVFTPSPDELGSYSFTVNASDGSSTVSQEVTVDVVADTNETTRISGVILNINGEPLAGVPIELGRISTLTEADGSFTLEIPDELLPTDSFDVEVPQGDIFFDPFGTGTQTIEMRRAGFDTSTGTDPSNPRRHPNLVSGFLDGSMAYGSDQGRADALRTLDGTGKLKTSPGDLLPFNNLDYFADGLLENESAGNVDPQSLFVAGDVRASENPALAALHTLLVREHNTLAESIATEDPTLTGEEIYQRARRVTIALVQKITYDEYLPLLLGQELSPYAGYDASVNPMASTLFSTSAFRIGHSQSTAALLTIDENGNEIPLSARATFFNTNPLIEDGIDPILRGLSQQLAQEVDTKVIDELRNFLFGPPGAGGFDLVSIGIQRGRDLGLPSYNQARIDLGLTPVSNWSDITSDVEVQQALADTYGDIEDVDVWVGGLAEDHVAGGTVGSLFAAIIRDQFERLRDGDRLWYENGQLSATELALVEGTTLGDLIERHTGITGLGDSVFRTTSSTHSSVTGYVATGDGSEVRSYNGSGNNETDSSLGSRGEHLRVDFSLDYGDGVDTPAGGDRPSARHISNEVFAQQREINSGIGATTMSVFWGQLIAHDLSLTPTGITTTLEIHGDDIAETGDSEYPFVAEKLSLVLGHDVYAGFNNVIERPIYLPALDTANAVTIDPSQTITVTTDNIPGAAVTIPAGSLTDQRGNPFTGQLSITEVPVDLTSAVLPEGLSPDMVVTIQPGEMVFSTPAPLSLPNLAGYGSGFVMDLWSINPETGDFDKVGVGQVSTDGSVVETIEGGIRNSSWHFFGPTPLNVTVDAGSTDGCNNCVTKEDLSSEVELDSGAVIESHDLVTYESLGVSRGVQLRYDSLRADPRPIIQFGYDDFNPNALAPGFTDKLRLLADLTIHIDDFDHQVPGFAGGQYGLQGGEHFWSVGSQVGDIDAALQADLSDVESGVYGYSLNSGIRLFVRNSFLGSSNQSQGQFIHINERDSAFGAGWGIVGIQKLIETSEGSVLLIDGDGSELLFDPPTDGMYGTPAGDFSTLEKLADGTFRRTMKDQMVYQFDVQNRLISVTDRNGNRTQHIYENDFLTKIIDPVGLETIFGYVDGKVTSITDPANRTTQLVYDDAGNLTRITDPDQSERTFGYDDQYHMTSEIDKRGNREETVYDSAGRAIQGIQKDGSVIQVQAAQTKGLYEAERTASPFNSPFVYTGTTGTASYSDQDGNSSETILDEAGQAISSTDGENQSGSIERDENNLITKQIDAKGNVIELSYDEQGNLIEIFDLVPAFIGKNNGFVIGDDPDQDFHLLLSSSSVSGLGDINGDGLDDFILTAAISGKVKGYVIFGNSIGFPQSLDLLTLDGSNGFVLEGSDLDGLESDAVLSDAVSGIGDINGDGYDDLIIGGLAPTSEPRLGPVALEPHVIFGRSSFPEKVNVEFDLLGDGRNGFSIAGLKTSNIRDVSFSGIGDINGDGLDDFIIGNPWSRIEEVNENNFSRVGAAHVFFGSTNFSYSIFDARSLDGSNGFVLKSPEFDDDFGFSVSGAGDINNDGIDDFMVTAPRSNLDPLSTAKTFVIFGHTTDFPANFNLSSFDGSNGFVLSGNNLIPDSAGFSAGGAGDINNDGIDDIFITAPEAFTSDFISQGQSYIILGQSEPFDTNINLSFFDETTFEFSSFDQNYGFSIDTPRGAFGSSIGDFNSDGYDDFIIGAPGLSSTNK